MTKIVALIGLGEAAETFARAGSWQARAQGWDLLPSRRMAMDEIAASSIAEALAGATLVLSLVTAHQALPAARAYAGHLAPGAIWCDGNSVAPDTKRSAASAVEAVGGRFVDMSILAPVQPAGLSVSLLLSGEAAHEAGAGLSTLGFTNVRVVGLEVGRASAIKMIRSVVVKGIEALTAEMMLAAEAAGVTDEVLASLDASDKAQPWSARAAYNLERMTTHGVRRAAEMEEAAATLEALGIEPVMTRATVRRQRDAVERMQSVRGEAA